MIVQNTEMISVIIPTFNRAWALKRAVDSALDQDYAHKEIIVVDDGSTDDTQEVLAGYDGQIRVLIQENKGVSAARNFGIKESRGGFIALLDSDDAWEKKKLSCQVDFFKSNPDAMICQTEEIWIRNGKRVNPKKKHKKPSGMIFEASLKLCLVSPSAVMIKRELLDQKGMFNEAFEVCEDYDLWLRISHDTPVYLIDTPLTIKTGGHDDQLSASHSQDKYRIQSILNLIESDVLTPSQVRAALEVFGEKCRIFANGCMKRGREKEAAHYLMLADRKGGA
nr:glycosyltransferase family 2 protein [uncultured Desulfobacter sp.]